MRRSHIGLGGRILAAVLAYVTSRIVFRMFEFDNDWLSDRSLATALIDIGVFFGLFLLFLYVVSWIPMRNRE